MSNWKDLLSFSKIERAGIIVLLIIILLVAIYPAIYSRIIEVIPYNHSEFFKAVEEFERKRLAATENEKADDGQNFEPQQKIVITPTFFDPNIISREELIAMGFPERLSNTINNFRNAGGVFRRKEDLQRIYGMSDNIYNQVEAYIMIPSAAEKTEPVRLSEAIRDNQHELASKEKDDVLPEIRQERPPLMININEADSVELRKLRGIGQVFSSRIIRYRELLGGFHCTTQLLEVYGMDTIRYNSIKDQIYTDGQLLSIDVNHADYAALVRHPYINRNMANSILMVRKQHGNYQNPEDIKRSDLIKDDVYHKIRPYIRVTDD